MSTLCNQSVYIVFKCITQRQLRENADWKQGKLHQKQFGYFFLLPSEDGDLLQSQLFWEIAGKIHFLFCWVPSKPHGWPLVLWWSLPPSASWESPLSQMVCFLLIITQQKLGYVLFIIHSFSLKKKKVDTTCTELCKSALNQFSQISARAERHQMKNTTITAKLFFPSFFLKVCCFVSHQ